MYTSLSGNGAFSFAIFMSRNPSSSYSGFHTGFSVGEGGGGGGGGGTCQ